MIKNLTSAEKQAYGETLITVAAEHRYPIGVLQATMCEEKKSLKERLIAIMNYHQKSKLIKASSVVLLITAVIAAIVLKLPLHFGTRSQTILMPQNIIQYIHFKERALKKDMEI